MRIVTRGETFFLELFSLLLVAASAVMVLTFAVAPRTSSMEACAPSVGIDADRDGAALVPSKHLLSLHSETEETPKEDMLLSQRKGVVRWRNIHKEATEEASHAKVPSGLPMEHGKARSGLSIANHGTSGGRSLRQQQTNTPSSAPTLIVIYDQNVPILPERVVADDDGFANDTGPAIIIGLSSSIIVCAFLLYAHDLGDRMKEKRESPQDHRGETEDKSMDGVGMSVASTEQDSGYWISTESRNLALLPPMAEDQQQDDAASIDRVSTLTQSCLGSIYAYSIGDKLNGMETSSQVTELSEENLVTQDMSINALVLKASDSRSTTPRGAKVHNDFEEILRIKDHPEEDDNNEDLSYSDMIPPNVSFHSDNISDSANDDPTASKKHSFAKLDEGETKQLVEGIDLDEVEQMVEALPSRNHVYPVDPFEVIRDVHFVPESKQISLGIGLASEEFPTVFSVAPSSPLAGRIFCGDSIIAIDAVDMINKSAETVLTMLGSGRPSTIKVKTNENNKNSEPGTQLHQSSFDLGEPETCMEV